MIQYLGIRTRVSTVLSEELRKILPLPHGAEAAAFRLERALAANNLLSSRAMRDRHEADRQFIGVLKDIKRKAR